MSVQPKHTKQFILSRLQFKHFNLLSFTIFDYQFYFVLHCSRTNDIAWQVQKIYEFNWGESFSPKWNSIFLLISWGSNMDLNLLKIYKPRILFLGDDDFLNRFCILRKQVGSNTFLARFFQLMKKHNELFRFLEVLNLD